MYRHLGLVFFAGVLIVAGVIIYRSIKSASDDTTPGPMDVSLQKLQARNTGFAISRVTYGNAPMFWVTDPKTQRTEIVPWQQSEDAAIEFVACNRSEIPAKLLYPSGSEPVCMKLTNEDYVLNAFYFHTPDLLSKVATFYDGPKKDISAYGPWREETGRQGVRPDGSRGFLYSYFLCENRSGGIGPKALVAFVGYKKEKRER